MNLCSDYPKRPFPAAASALRRKRRKSRRKQRGFNLIELMVVLVIIGLLAGLVGPRLLGTVESSKVRTADTQVKMLKGALMTYALDVGNFPSTSEGLAALMAPPADAADYWNGPYLDDELPLDPWRTPYRYEFPADNLQGYALYSLGADAQPGGEGNNADIGYLPAEPAG
ncbi:MAG: type II secretion system protein GspG [Gammaproteobacteria bacterium]|nr:type II secretion system protein GspG [Gammaproteobacteria bacterium]